MTPSLVDLSRTASTATSLEELARPVLEILQAATGLDSTYLTTIDLQAGQQHVQYALNTGRMNIPEGLTVPWSDTLCRRALEDGAAICKDVPARWGDSAAARELGIMTYASAPVRTSSGALVGTLCAAGTYPAEMGDWARSTLNMCSRLLGQHFEREVLVQQLQDANTQLAVHALSDALTGLPNRRAVFEELARMLARCGRDGTPVLVGLVDLDRFKHINDSLGHVVGDSFLKEVGRRLAAAVRATDMVGRIGGDEFVVLGPGPQDGFDPEEAASTLQHRLAEATAGQYLLGDTLLHYDGASVGVVALPADVDAEEAMRQADEAMYCDKRKRRGLPTKAI